MGDPEKGEIIAFLDMGTNSIRLLVVRLNPNSSYTVLTQQKEIVRLGEGEFSTHTLSGEAIGRAVIIVKKFVELGRSFGMTRLVAVATSATREAHNRHLLIERLEKEADCTISVLPGKEEARLIYHGVSSGIDIGETQALFIDIGGGSTEMIVGNQASYSLLESLKIGAIRLTEMFFPDGTEDPVPLDKYLKVRRYVRHTIVHSVNRISHEAPSITVGSSGTIETLSLIADRLFHKGLRQTPHPVLTRQDLGEVTHRLCAVPLEERKKIPGLSPNRADIIIAGAAILETIMDELELCEIRVSDRNLKEGLLVDYLQRREGFPHAGETSVRRRSVVQLGRSCGIDEEHADKTISLALQLFDSGKRTGLHGMGDWERELLEYAAYLHDTGGFISFSNHHIHSAYIVSNADLLGFDQEEISVISLIARYHRKKTPRKRDQIFKDLDEERQQIVKLLSAFLRIAESLERSHAALVDSAEFTAIDNETVTIEICSSTDCTLEVWALQSDREAVAGLLGRRLVIACKCKGAKNRLE